MRTVVRTAGGLIPQVQSAQRNLRRIGDDYERRPMLRLLVTSVTAEALHPETYESLLKAKPQAPEARSAHSHSARGEGGLFLDLRSASNDECEPQTELAKNKHWGTRRRPDTEHVYSVVT